MNTSPLQNDYRTQAENIVSMHFLLLDEAEQKAFFELLYKICPKDSSVYRTLHEHYNLFQKQEKRLTHQHKYYLLLLMPKFLPTDVQCKLLQCEFLDAVQRYHVAYQQGSFVFSWEEDVWESYKKYVDKIYLLQNHALQWFAPDAFEAQDRQDVASAIQYVCLQEASEAMHNFEQDTRIMRTQSHTSLSKLRYKESFFGLSVKVTRSSTRQASDYAPQDLVMPEFVGKFARLLYEYIAQHMAHLDQQKVQNDVQESVLRQDLGIAIQHYESSKSMLKKVDVSLALQGRGGTITLDTQNLVTRESTIGKDILQGFLFAMGALVLIPLSIMIGIPILLFVLAFVFITFPYSAIPITWGIWWYWSRRRRKRKIENYPVGYASALVANFRQDFDDIVGEKIAKASLLPPNQTIWQNLFALLWHKVLASMKEERVLLQNPDTALKVCKKYMRKIKKLKTKGLEDYFDGVWEVTPQTCLEVMRYVMKQKLQQAYLQCMHITNEVLALNLDAELYMPSLDVRLTLYNFYSGEPDFPAFKRRQEKIDGFREEVSMPPLVHLLGSESLQAWYEQQQQNLQQNRFEQDFTLLRKQMQAMAKAKKEAKGLSTPIFFENMEVIAYIF